MHYEVVYDNLYGGRRVYYLKEINLRLFILIKIIDNNFTRGF